MTARRSALHFPHRRQSRPGYHNNNMARLYIRKLPAPRAPIHTCALPEPLFMPVEVQRIDSADENTVVRELIPFGDWRAETINHDRLRKKAGGAMGCIGSTFTLEDGRVFERFTLKTNRDR